MSITRIYIALLLISISFLTQSLALASHQPEPNLGTSKANPVTVADMIQMTQLADGIGQGGLLSQHDIAQFSPDGDCFVIVLKRGNIATNTNDYWIQYFSSANAMHANGGKTLVHFSSSSNRPAIQQLQWRDNHTLEFIAENAGEVSQLYSLDVNTHKLSQLTQSSTTIRAYAMHKQEHYLVYAADEPYRHTSPFVVVTHQPLLDLLTLHNETYANRLNVLYVHDQRTGQVSPVTLQGRLVAGSPMYLSPNGHYMIVKTMLSGTPPKQWEEYQDESLQAQLRANHSDDDMQIIYQYELVDLHTQQGRRLLNSPIPTGQYPDVRWSLDSSSVILSGVLLPLDKSNDVDDAARKAKKFVVELSIHTGRVVPITEGAFRLTTWDSTTGKLYGNSGSWSGGGSLHEGRPTEYDKNGDTWRAVANPKPYQANTHTIEVSLEEDMNTPPRIVVQNKITGEKSLLLDLNPEFRALEFGKVCDLGSISDGSVSVKAGIYFPVGYEPGVRYPLIIQTHEWSSERFWIDGPFSSAFAGQAFAGKGFVVAQIALNRNHQATQREVEDEAKGYEMVVDYLDKRHLIDTTKMGIIGFSRSALGVRYELAHSKWHYAAATIADGSDVGYFRYIAYLNSTPWQTADAEGINGGLPVVGHIDSWFRNALDADLEQLSTPMRLEVYSPENLLFTWEIFGLLDRLRRPVDFIYLPDGRHVLVKPSERMVSQQGNVDWFCFWLKAERPINSADPSEYQRWKLLRERLLSVGTTAGKGKNRLTPLDTR